MQLKPGIIAASRRSFFASYLVPFIMTVTSIALAAIGSSATHWLQYDRQAILHLQIWRLVTGHLVHLNSAHLWMNLAALWLCFGNFGTQISNRYWMVAFLICAMAISMGLLAFNPGIAWYVGLSGVLHGLFCAGATAALKNGDRTAWLWLCLICGKLLLEQWHGSSSEALIGAPVIVNAHLYGAIAGLLFAFIFLPAKESCRG